LFQIYIAFISYSYRLVGTGTELFLFTAAHKTSEFSNLSFNQVGFLLPINRLCF